MKRAEEEEADGSEDSEEGTPDDTDEEPKSSSKSSKGSEPAYQAPREEFATKIKRVLRTYRFPISVVVAVLGFVIFFFGLFAWTPLASSGPLENLEQSLLGQGCTAGSNFVSGSCTSTSPDWTLAMLPGGGLLGAIGAYLAVTYTVARRRFEHLMKTKSKAEFLRNVTEAEDLLWDLTPEDEIRLVRKKQDLKIRV